MADRLRLEAQAAASLRHNPHIVQVSDLGCTADGSPYLVMEKLEGRDLRAEVVARGPLPVVEAVAVARQVLAGLAAAHAIGIVHRDIKPANLFLCASGPGAGVVKILDFGIAKVLETADPGRAPSPLTKPTLEGVALGTPHYLSPEQALGRPVDGRSDIYGVAAVLYWLLAGRAPFQHHKGTFAVMRAHVTDRPAPLSSLARQPIPAALDRVLLKALAKEKSDRFKTAEEFSAELARVLEAAPVPQRWPQTERIDTRAFRAATQAPQAPAAADATAVEARRDSAAETLHWSTTKQAVELPADGPGEAQRDSTVATLPASPMLSPPGRGTALDPPGEAPGTASAAHVRHVMLRRGLFLGALVIAALACALILISLARARFGL